MIDKKNIDILYDHEKFNTAIEQAAVAFVERVMGTQAHTEAGANTLQIVKGNALSLMSKLPIEYYQVLESYLDGKAVSNFAVVPSDHPMPDYAEQQTEKGLIELITACSGGVWKVKNPEEAKTYYRNKFRAELEALNVAEESVEEREETMARRNEEQEVRLGFWEKIAKKRAIAKSYKQQIKLKTQAIKNAIKKNEKISKAYLAEYKQTHTKEEYKRISTLMNKQMKENRKWSRLEIAHVQADLKYEQVLEQGALDDKASISTLRRAANKQAATQTKMQKFLNDIYGMAETSDRRNQTVGAYDLSYVYISGVDHTTVEEEWTLLNGERAAEAVEVESFEGLEEAVERFEEENRMRERVAYMEEIQKQGVAVERKEGKSVEKTVSNDSAPVVEEDEKDLEF